MNATATATPAVPRTENVAALAEVLLDQARRSRAGRAAQTLTPGAGLPLKQTVFALEEGVKLTEHSCPPAATLHVLAGRVCLVTDGGHVELAPGDHAVVPPVRHSLTCLDDAAVLLTVARPADAETGADAA